MVNINLFFLLCGRYLRVNDELDNVKVHHDCVIKLTKKEELVFFFFLCEKENKKKNLFIMQMTAP